MRVAIETEKSPLDQNIETVMPGVIQLHRATDISVKQVGVEVHAVRKQVSSLEGTLQKLDDDLKQITPNLVHLVRDVSTESRTQIGRTFLKIATQLLGTPESVPHLECDTEKGEETRRKWCGTDNYIINSIIDSEKQEFSDKKDK